MEITSSMDKKVSVVDHNDISTTVIENRTVQANRSCIWIQNRKLLWILSSIIATILIILAITIPTVIILKKKQDTDTSARSTTDFNTITIINTSVPTSTIGTTTELEASLNNISITDNTKWNQNGVTIAGGNSYGSELNQFHTPGGIYVDDNHTIYVSDSGMHRIVEWKSNATYGEIVVDGNEEEVEDEFFRLYPTNFILDKQNDSFIICDTRNQQVVKWPRTNGTTGQIIIPNIACSDLTLDSEGYLYVSDSIKHEVRRWKIGDKDGILVAGGNGKGNNLNQLDDPTYIFVDQNNSLYVTDFNNYRIMQWIKGENVGIVVARGQIEANKPTQMNVPYGLTVDQLGNIYVVDSYNNRVMRWIKGTIQGNIIIGEGGFGSESNQLRIPTDLSFDRFGNLIVLDGFNYRVQIFIQI